MVFETPEQEKQDLDKKIRKQHKLEQSAHWKKVPMYYMLGKKVVKEPASTTILVHQGETDEQAVREYFKNKFRTKPYSRRSLFIEDV